MRRSTTSGGTDRLLLGLLLVAELVIGIVLVVRAPGPATGPFGPIPSGPPSAALPSVPPESVAQTTHILADGRRAQLVGLAGVYTAGLLDRIAAELDSAAAAVTDFWGDDWSQDIVIVATGSDEQFRALTGGAADIAAVMVDRRIVFAPGAAGMTDTALRVVLRHELFHYAALPHTVADAPRWLTEGVADFVARPVTRPHLPRAVVQTVRLPTDSDLDTPGPVRSQAYDRAWWFASFVAGRYGADQLRELYLRACGPGRTDVGTAVRDVLGADLDDVLAGWQRWLTR